MTLQLRAGMSQHEVRAAVERYQQRLAAEQVMADAVDSVELRLIS